MNSFINLQNKFATQRNTNEKKNKKDKNYNIIKIVFILRITKLIRKIKFHKKTTSIKTEYVCYFLFSLVLIFSIKIVHISLNKIEIFNNENSSQKFTLLRRDITDRNGVIL